MELNIEKTGVVVVDVQGDFTEVKNGSLAVQGTGRNYVDKVQGATKAFKKKGSDPRFDSYSGFFDDGGTPTGLDKILHSHNLDTLVLYGLATDYCVKATAMDALRSGFKVILIEDLCKGVAPDTTQTALEEMALAGIQIMSLAKIGYA